LGDVHLQLLEVQEIADIILKLFITRQKIQNRIFPAVIINFTNHLFNL